jgi:MFS family permease
VDLIAERVVQLGGSSATIGAHAPRIGGTMTAIRASAWAPLSHPVFRALWLAGLASDFGARMHQVGEGWLMTSLSASPLDVALLEAADSLAIFLLAIPAGALADVADRRRLAFGTQVWLMVAALLLALFAIEGWMTPKLLIGLTFVMGLGGALDEPLWPAIVSEVVPSRDLPQAVTLGGLSINLARAFAPAIGGVLVAAEGPYAVFLINAVTFAIVLFVVLRWKREKPRSAAPAERWFGALQGGLRFTRNSPGLIAAFVRAAATLVGGTCVIALLPAFARNTLGLDSLGFGLLLGCMGIGAVIAATLLPNLDGKVSADAVLSAGTIVYAGSVVALALAQNLAVAMPAMLIGGVAWMALVSSVNVAVQVATPSWYRARVSAVFMVVFQGSIVLGSVVWGWVAERSSVRVALMSGAACIAASIIARIWLPLAARVPDFSPSVWPKPTLLLEPSDDAGPVLVTIRYHVPETNRARFVVVMFELERLRRRSGAFDWRLYRDPSSPHEYTEAYAVDSWAEHLRQHERVTKDETAVEEEARSLSIGGAAPEVRHLIAVDDSALPNNS